METNDPAKVGRNDPCFCGSGKKFKKCCLDTVTASQTTIVSSAAEGAVAKQAPMGQAKIVPNQTFKTNSQMQKVKNTTSRRRV